MLERKQGYVGWKTGLCWIENRVMLARKQGYRKYYLIQSSLVSQNSMEQIFFLVMQELGDIENRIVKEISAKSTLEIN